MSKNFITETIRSFDYKRDAHFYKIDNIMKLISRITHTGVVLNFNRVTGTDSIVVTSFGADVTGPPSNNSNEDIPDQISIVELLKLFNSHNFDMKKILQKVSEDVYPPMPQISNSKAKEFCEVMNYSGLYIAKYWIRVILSNPDYFSNIPAIFKNYI